MFVSLHEVFSFAVCCSVLFLTLIVRCCVVFYVCRLFEVLCCVFAILRLLRAECRSPQIHKCLPLPKYQIASSPTMSREKDDNIDQT